MSSLLSSAQNITEHISKEVVEYLREADEIRKEWMILKKSARCCRCSIWFYNNFEPYEMLNEYFECTKCKHIFCNNCISASSKNTCWECGGGVDPLFGAPLFEENLSGIEL